MSLAWPDWYLLGLLALAAVVAAFSPLWMARPHAIGRFARTAGLPLDGDEPRAYGELHHGTEGA